MTGKTTVLRDPVHGDIELTAEEIRVVDTPEFQRLRGVRQLGTAYLVYPGAVHTRFEHSIGTMHVTQRLIDAIHKNASRDPDSCRSITPDETRLLRLAALLHDVTHIPFGHNIEDQTGLLERHDTASRFAGRLDESRPLGRTLRDLGVRDEILAILTGSATLPPFMRQLLSDTIDPDLLDYLRRDAYFTGLELRYDARVAAYFRVDARSGSMFVDCEKEGMLREDIMSELMRLLETRYHFSERVYYHHAKVAAGALIARMVELALRAGAFEPSFLHDATDQSLLVALAQADLGSPADNARLGRFVTQFAGRQLPKRIAVFPAYLNRDAQLGLLETYFTPGAPEARYAWEADMESAARERFRRDIDVILYCPARQMQLKEARTLVRMPGSGTRTVPMSDFATEIPRLSDLQESYLRLWKLYVFTSERDLAIRTELQQMALERLPGATNALRL